MPRFEPPDWASPPQKRVSLQADGNTIRIDERPHYVVGRGNEGVDIVFEDESLSRHHAALVHHTTGKIYVIDLQTTHGTFLDGVQIEKYKPTKLFDGQKLVFGALSRTFTVSMEDAPAKQYKASHLLVKHKDVRNPKSWKEPVVTRTQEEALKLIRKFQDMLTSGDPATLLERFADLASHESHCSSAKRGGDLGIFGPGQMQKPFEDAVAALKVGDLSDPVFTASGVHLIIRTL